MLPASYRVYRKDRSDGYGGILIGIKRQYQSELFITDDCCEICAVKLKTTRNPNDIMILISVYRPLIEKYLITTYFVMLFIALSRPTQGQ